MPDFVAARPDVIPGQQYCGMVTGIQPYGAFVRFGNDAGLCHQSALPRGFVLENLSRGDPVLVEVLTVADSGRIALMLIKTLPRKAAGHGTGNGRKSGIIRNVALAAETVRYGHQIGDALAEGAKIINEVGQQYRANPAPSRAGFVAEATATAEFNADAAFKNSKVRAHRVDSNGAKSPDIVVTNGSGKVAQEVSSKVYKTADKTANAQRGYDDQVRLVPKDQLDDIKRSSRQRAESNRAKGKPTRD